MRKTSVLTALIVSLIASTAIAEADKTYDLRGPAPKAGDITIITVDDKTDKYTQPLDFKLGDPDNPNDKVSDFKM